MTQVRTYMKTRFFRLLELIDSDSIIVNQMLFYVLIAVSGFYNIFFSNIPIQAMELATSGGYYTFWLWLCLLGPITTMVGKACSKNWAYTGLIFELAGDIATWIIFVCFVSATFGTADWGKGLFGGFLAIACLIGTPVFITKDVRKLRLVEQKVKRESRIGH